MNQLSLIPGLSGADFSECKKYRYQLTRTWDESKPIFAYIGVNPSYAGWEVNDNTTTRNLNRAVEIGAGGYIAVNLFAWVSTDPIGMKKATDPVGPRNDEAIRDAVKKSKWVLCGWGIHGNHRDRNKEVVELLGEWRDRLYYLKMTKDGNPGHPLYLRKKEKLKLLNL